MLFTSGGLSVDSHVFELLIKILWISSMLEGPQLCTVWPSQAAVVFRELCGDVVISDFLHVLHIPAFPLAIAKRSQK